MGKNSGGERGRGRKNKARMNYLKDVKRQGKGGGDGSQQEGSGRGYKTGDYVSAYGYGSRGQGGWGRGGGGGRGGQGSRKPRAPLTGGMKGFILTTNFRESDCVRDAYNLLNEYDEKKEGEADDNVVQILQMDSSEPGADKEKLESTETGEGGKEDVDEEEDISEALEKEMEALKSNRVARRFNCVDTGVRNVVFINTTVEDPTKIIYRIYDDVLENHEAKSRHILRFMPIEATCKMDLETVKEVAKGIFQKYFKDGYKSFKIVVNVRNNSSISRDEVIKTVAEAVDAVNPLNFVDLKNATHTIVAEVLKGVMCLAVLKDFMKYKKFNIAEAAAPDKPSEELKNPEESETERSVEKMKILTDSAVEEKREIVGSKTENCVKQPDKEVEAKEEGMVIDDAAEKEKQDKSPMASPTKTGASASADVDKKLE